jgi:diguanylate cyclase (GGDEF)-like protein
MKNILLVESDEKLLRSIQDRLYKELSGIKVSCARNYKDAMRFIIDKNFDIDVAILDFQIEGSKDGNLIKYAIKKNITIVVLTNIDNEDTRKSLLENEIFDYILKDGKRDVEFVVKSVSRIIQNYDTHILVVDDSKTQLAVAAQMIKNMNIQVTTAYNGQEALDILNNSKIRFSLILTDYNMPVMDGMELTLKIREKYDKDQLGIIVLSASDKEEISTQFIKMGANDFLYKPYTQIEVQTRINANLELLELFSQVRDVANKDFLTGMYNRRYFFETGKLILDTAKRESKNIAVAMIDIDKFKNINDTYGHDTGDVAICDVARVLRCKLRHTDLVARFGGEEFCVLLQNISLEDTTRIFENIRLAFEENIIKLEKQTINFTVSIGVLYGTYDNLEVMLKKADEGLYFCKNNGRNQIKVYNSL